MAPGSWCVVVGHVYSRQSLRTEKSPLASVLSVLLAPVGARAEPAQPADRARHHAQDRRRGQARRVGGAGRLAAAQGRRLVALQGRQAAPHAARRGARRGRGARGAAGRELRLSAAAARDAEQLAARRIQAAHPRHGQAAGPRAAARQAHAPLITASLVARHCVQAPRAAAAANRPSARCYVENTANIWPTPARPKRLIGRGWPKLGAAWSTTWR
eukprot:scaffold102697_cov69-Phaeocystis_antarctica.AAC.2